MQEEIGGLRCFTQLRGIRREAVEFHDNKTLKIFAFQGVD
jgi:hypothetical protein